MLLQQKYGKQVKDLLPTRRSEFNLYGDWKDADAIVSRVQGNLWMSQYTSETEKVNN